VRVGKRAKYATVWVALAAAATVTGLAAGGVVRSAVGADDATITLSQDQVLARLSGGTSGPAPSRTTGPSSVPSATSAPHPSRSPSATPTHGAGGTPSAGSNQHSTPPSKPPTKTPTPTPTPTPSSQSGLIYSSGGSVVAQCSGSSARIVSVSPAQGYSVAGTDYGPAQELEVVFTSSTGGPDVDIHITCRNGVPVGQVDDSGGE
jgi:hypothetical protein